MPQAIRDRGTLLVTGSAGTAPPLRFYATDDKTLIGSEIDFAYLIGDVLGLEVEISAADWAQNFVRIDSGEVDAFISNVTVTEERKEKYDFATYRLDTLALETKKDTDWTVNEPTGRGGQDHRRRLRHQPGEDPGRLERAERRRGPRADRHQVLPERHRLLPGPVVRPDRRLLRPQPDRPVPRGQRPARPRSIGTFSGAGDALQGEIAVLTKKDNGLVKAFAEAINHTIENGTYQQVLDRWNLASEAVATSEINPPGLPKTAS